MPSGTLSPTTAQLCRLLIEEEAACRSLLETVQEERAAIRTLAITEFHTINCRRLAILESLQTLAEERTRVVRQLAEHHGLQAGTCSLHQLLDHLTDSGSGDLQARYNSFMSTAKTVRDEIKQNVVLIENIRGVVDKALSAGTALVPGHDLYNHDGHSSRVSPLNVLIHQQG